MEGHSISIHFKDILDGATDLIHVVTPEGIILYANDSWRRALQYSLEDVIGHSIYEFIPDEEREEFIDYRNELLYRRRIHGAIETTFVTKTGQKLLVEGFMSCYMANGHVKYTHSVLRDVTIRKQQEREFQEAIALVSDREQNFHQLIENAPDAIIVIDEESKIKLWNPKSQMIFGWSFEEVEGTLLGETIIPEQYRQRHYEGMKRYLTTGEVHVLNKTIDITALNKQGQEFFVALTISKAVLKGQSIFIAFIRDISEQKKMAEEIRLQKEQLEKTNEELAQYASFASHDLKEPIRKILIFCDLLLNSSSPKNEDQQKEIINKVFSSAKRMEMLIESVRKFSTISSLPLEANTILLNDIINEVLEDLEENIRNKKATVQLSGLPSVRVNRIHLYQLFQNLINNSLKFSKSSLPPIITMAFDHESEGYAFIRLSDNGIGFSNQYADKIFQPFQRLHGHTYAGTGIGLSICKKIIEIYGGHISVHSIAGEGSTFLFSLPIKN